MKAGNLVAGNLATWLAGSCQCGRRLQKSRQQREATVLAGNMTMFSPLHSYTFFYFDQVNPSSFTD